MPVKSVAKKISLKRAAADPEDNHDDNDTEEKQEKVNDVENNGFSALPKKFCNFFCC